MTIRSYVGALLLLLLSFSSTINAQVFHIGKYGAKGDGKSDIRGALLSAWKDACASTTPARVLIPGGKFALSEVALRGPCKAPVDIQLKGTLRAPADPSRFKTDGWVVFEYIDRLTLSGGGTFDGQGKIAWARNDCHKNKNCRMPPINLRFNFVTNALIQRVKTLDSKFFHVNVLGCKNVTFRHFTVVAPDESMNTDGIHIGRSVGIHIRDSTIKTGDDCVSIGDGSKQIFVTGVKCGPGHGISIGSLGKYQNEEPVEGIFVKNCTISGGDNGVRIKTWPASPAGTASDIHFEDILMNNVKNPVLIDQGYCPWNQCKPQLPSRVKISKVSFERIRGTSTSQVAVRIACSKSVPCENIKIADIDLAYHGPEGPATSECANVHPSIAGRLNPRVCAMVTS